MTLEEADLMKSLSLIGRDRDGNALHGISSLWTLPTKILTKLNHWIMNILSFPFQLIGRCISSCWTSLTNIQFKTKFQNAIASFGIQQFFISIWESIPNIHNPIVLLENHWITIKSFVLELYMRNKSIALDKWRYTNEMITSSFISKTFHSIWYWFYTKYNRGGNTTG